MLSFPFVKLPTCDAPSIPYGLHDDGISTFSPVFLAFLELFFNLSFSSSSNLSSRFRTLDSNQGLCFDHLIDACTLWGTYCSPLKFHSLKAAITLFLVSPAIVT